ncbi:MAG: Rieske 2Fe-2S domain-containing protein [Chloroflexi bacterium]|nr:Rieske 2Fe-2S domain-containing protein [Chloroflexota bacterium]
MSKQPQKTCDHTAGTFSRREFLRLGGGTIVAISLPAFLRNSGLPETVHMQQVAYPRQIIGKMSSLQTGQPVFFNYPWDHSAALNFLVRLPEPAGGGIGSDNNIVAFNSFCTHLGEGMQDQVLDHVGVAGPCPYHLTTFDLNRYGLVISGHATQPLPQIILETDGDDIVATGVMGLIYSFFDNRIDPNT